MENEYVKTTVENLITYLKRTQCGKWKQTQNAVEWRRVRYWARMRLVHGFSSDLEELLAIRRGEAEGFWIAFFEFYPGIVAERCYRRQTAELCAAIAEEPCFAQLSFEEGEVVIRASMPLAENSIKDDTIHMIEHIVSEMIDAYREDVDALAHGHCPFSLGRKTVIPHDVKPVSAECVDKTATAVRSFLEDYQAHSFTIESRKNGLPVWESLLEIGSRKANSSISITDTGVLKTAIHLTANSRPLQLSQRAMAAQCFQYEWDSCLPASVWIGNDDEPPMICAYASLEGGISEKTLIALENCVVQTYDALIDVLGQVVEGFAPERSIRYRSSLRCEDRLTCLKRVEEAESRCFDQPRIDMADFFRDMLGEETDDNAEVKS